jgi:hypothetical protein
LKRLANPKTPQNNTYALAQDFLEAGKLAAQLERPRSEVDGLFAQARRLALKRSTPNLIIRCHYHHAWRTYFYFDDPAEVERIYEQIEAFLSQA